MSNFLTNINLNQNQLMNALAQNLATQPLSPEQGQVYFNTTDKKLKWYDGAKWVNADSTDAQMTNEDIISAINNATTKINKDSVEGLQEMVDNVSMSGSDIIDAINSEPTKKVSISQIQNLQSQLSVISTKASIEDLATKENVGVAQNKADTALQSAKQYTDAEILKAIDTLLDGAGDQYDTFKELEEWIIAHRDDIDSLLEASHKHAQKIGDGVALEHTVNHNLNSRDVVVTIRETNAPYSIVFADVEIVDLNNIIVRTAQPIDSADTLTVTVVG